MADIHERALERFDLARDAWRENYDRAREDLRFSNPACPEQWDAEALKVRQGRPCLTFDRTNTYIRNVVNDSRQNKPSLLVIPADSDADKEAALKLQGILRHIEYVSRAQAAYDTAIDHAVRCGIGWLKVEPQVIDAAMNYQEPRILRVADPLSCLIDPDAMEPDGSDAMWAFSLSVMTRQAFQRTFGKRKEALTWKVDGEWFLDENRLVVAEYQEVVESSENRIMVVGPDRRPQEVGEDEYWQMPMRPTVIGTFAKPVRTVKRVQMTGAAVLDSTDFPAEHVGIIPVYGNDLCIEGRRYISGMTRELRDSQQFVNYELSALAESLRNQPKAPFLAAWQAVRNHEGQWAEMAEGGNPAVLYYDSFDKDGQPLPQPSRLAPPAFPAGFSNAAMTGATLMDDAVGLYRANFGQQSNETSGRAINARKVEGDTATFHYPDNLARSMAHLGRVCLEMLPTLMDSQRSARILGEDDAISWVQVDPEMQGAVGHDEDGKVTAINPGFGAYDVRVKVGPAYATMREQAADQMAMLSQGNPQLAAALAPMLAEMRDMPQADKIARVALAMLPPQVQQAYKGDEEGPQIPPEVMGQMQAMQQQLGQAQQIVRDLAEQLEQAQAAAQQAKDKTAIEAFRAETDRLKVTQAGMTPEQVQALVVQTLQQLATPTAIG